MKITINVPDKVFETCMEDEYFQMRVDFNANDNTIKSITIDDGYEFTEAGFSVNEQPSETEERINNKRAFIKGAYLMLLSDMLKKKED